MTKAYITLGWREHRTHKMYTGRRDTAHTVLMRGTIGVWTPNNIWGDTAHTFLLMGSIWVGTLRNIRGDTAHTFLMRGTIGVGTLHNIEKEKA